MNNYVRSVLYGACFGLSFVVVVFVSSYVWHPSMQLATAAAPQNDVTARSFTLVDGNGKVRATLGMLDGDPSFALLNAAGNARIVVSTDGDNAVIVVADKNGDARAGYGLVDNDSGLMLFDEKNEGRATFLTQPNGAIFGMNDDTDKVRIVAGALGTNAGFAVYNRTGGTTWSAPPDFSQTSTQHNNSIKHFASVCQECGKARKP
ncbi:MAG: hypothetical protein ACYDBB_12590 [Armatimonadota bacterium]